MANFIFGVAFSIGLVLTICESEFLPVPNIIGIVIIWISTELSTIYLRRKGE